MNEKLNDDGIRFFKGCILGGALGVTAWALLYMIAWFLWR